MSSINYREDQIPIINYQDGTMAVPAVPGAGKTFIVTNLVAKLLAQGKHRPGKILILTYMNSAVNNFKVRIAKLLEEREIQENNSYEVMTIHSLAVKIIKEKPDTVMLNDEFSIVDDLKKTMMLNDCINNWKNSGGERIFRWFLKEQKDIKWQLISLENWERGFFDVVGNLINELKYVDISPEKLKEITIDDNEYRGFLRCIAPIYYEYSKKLKENGLLDYDDILILGCKALESDEELRSKFQNKYTYIFEDECQDSNKLQGRILKLLSQKNNNLVRVGDVNQSINGTFSSSSPKFFKAFMLESDKVCKMDMSNRSSKDVIDIANELVRYIKNDIKQIECRQALEEMNIKTVPIGVGYKENPITDKYYINYKMYETLKDEIYKTVNFIVNIKKQYPSKSIGILLPYNNQVKEVAEVLSEYNLEFDELSSNSIHKRKLINNIGYILDYAYDCDDVEKLCKVLDKTFIKTDNKISRENILENLKKYEAEEIIFNIKTILDEMPVDKNENIYIDLIKGSNIINKILDYPSIKIDEFILFIANKLELSIQEKAMTQYIAFYAKYLKNDDINLNIKTLADILLDDKNKVFNYISDIIYEMNGYEVKPGGITVCTYHKSKGMEWDCVFALDLTEFKFPSNISQKFQGEYWYLKEKFKNPIVLGKSEIESILTGNKANDYLINYKIEIINEKIRLLYVGITRAKEMLIMSASKFNDDTKRKNPQKPSEYVSILMNYIDKKRRG